MAKIVIQKVMVTYFIKMVLSNRAKHSNYFYEILTIEYSKRLIILFKMILS